MNTAGPTPQFARSLHAALAFWKRQLETGKINELDGERQNLHRTIEMGLALPETRIGANEAILESFDLVYNMGYWREWLAVLERAIAVCPDEARQLKVDLQIFYGELLRFCGHSNRAVAAHKTALVLAAQLDDPLRTGKAHTRLGQAYQAAGQFDNAEDHCQAALKFLEQAGEAGRPLVANALVTLGQMAWRRGDLVAAKDYLGWAVVIRRQLRDILPLAQALYDLGEVCHSNNELIETLRYYSEAERLLDGSKHKLDLFNVQYNKGVLLFGQQLWPEAEEVFKGIDLDYYRQTGNLLYEARVVTALGNTVLYQARADEAAALLRRAVRLWGELDDKLELANAVGSLGEALAANGEREAAEIQFNEALHLLEQLPEHPRVAKLQRLFSAELQKLAKGQV
jgi:tetratricopeptide (TPR) repeat protein